MAEFDGKKELKAFTKTLKSKTVKEAEKSIGENIRRNGIFMEPQGDGLNEKKFSANLRKIGKSKRTSKAVSAIKLASVKK